MPSTSPERARRQGVDRRNLVQAYLTELHVVPLLSRSQEEDIGRRIEKGESQILAQILSLPGCIEEVMAIRHKLREGELEPADVIRGSGINLKWGNGSGSLEDAVMRTWARAEKLWKGSTASSPAVTARIRELLAALPINLRLLESHHETLRAILTSVKGAATATCRQVAEAARLTLSELRSMQSAVARADEIMAAAKDEMILGNLRLAANVAMRYANRGVPLSDLIQEGNLGLIKAVDRFDYGRGYRFSTYATWWIMQAILRGAAEQLGACRIPAHIMESFGKVQEAAVKLRGELGRNPTPEELGKRTKVPATTIRRMMTLAGEPVSIDSPVPGCEDIKLLDIMEDEKTPEPSKFSVAMELRQYTRRLLSSLSPREEKMLRIRFGIGHDGEGTLDEIGNHFAISGERARQILNKAIASLRCSRHKAKVRNLLLD